MAVGRSGRIGMARDEKKDCKQPAYEVEKVIGHREVMYGSKPTAEYLVQWLDYPLEDASWQPWKNLKSCMQLVRDYHKRNSRMVNRRFPHHSHTHRMSLRSRNVEDDSEEKSLHDEWEVEDILGHEHSKEGKVYYLVKWRGHAVPIWSEENRVLQYDSKGNFREYMNENVQGSNAKCLNESNVPSNEESHVEFHEFL